MADKPKKRTMSKSEIDGRAVLTGAIAVPLGTNLAVVPALTSDTAVAYAKNRARERHWKKRDSRIPKRLLDPKKSYLNIGRSSEVASRAVRRSGLGKANKVIGAATIPLMVAGGVGAALGGHKLSKKYLTKKYGKEKKAMYDAFFDELSKISRN